MNSRFAGTTLAVWLALELLTLPGVRAQTGTPTSDQNQPQPSAAATETPPAPSEDLGALEALLGESVVTTASRTAERASTAPSTVYTITSEELRTYGIRSIDEALGYIGVGVYTSSARDYSTGVDVGAQGVLLRDAGQHMLVLLDGHVMNSQATGGISINEAFGVPIETIDHIEVMLGAGSVVYGSSAMLLVINVITQGARGNSGVHLISEIGSAAPHDRRELISRDGRYELRYRLGAIGATTFGEDADLMVSAEWLDDHSNSYGMGPYAGTGYGAISLRSGERAWGGLADHHMLTPSGLLVAHYKDVRLLLQANHYERSMPLVATFGDPDSRERQDAFRFDLQHSIDLTPHLTLGSRLYGDYARFEESTTWTGVQNCPDELSSCWLQRSANASWLGLEEQASFDWFLDSNVTTTFGFDVRGRRTETNPAEYRGDANAPPVPGFTPPHTVAGGFLGAIFAQQVWKPRPWLTLNAGARFDADTDFGAHISPRAAITVEPTDSTSIRTSYSEAFRGPTRYELEDTDLAYRITPTSLDAEEVQVVELEVQQRLSWISFSVRGYASFYSEFIDTRAATANEFANAMARGDLVADADPSVVVVNDNLATITSVGVTPSLTLRLARGLQAGASFSYAHSRLNGKPLAVIPNAFGNVHIAWQPVINGVTIAAAAIIAGDRKISSIDIPTADTLGPQFDLKTTLSGPTGIARLRFRASLTYVHNAYLPYTPLFPGSQAPGEARLVFPVITRLQGFIGLQYDLER